MAPRKIAPIQIDHIWALSGPQCGAITRNAVGGNILWITGKNFGKDITKVEVFFNAAKANPLSVLFSNESLAVQAPILQADANELRILVAGQASAPVEFELVPGINPKAPGGAIVALYNMVDAYSFLLARLATAAPMGESRKAVLYVAADYLDGARVGAQKSLQMLMQWQQYQHKVEQAPIRTLEFTDGLIDSGNLVRTVATCISLSFGATGWLSPVINSIGVRNFVEGLIEGGSELFSDFTDTLKSLLKEAYETIHESSKIIEGIENLGKIATPSLSAEVGVGVDVSFSSGEAFSALAKGIDVIGQSFSFEAKESESDKKQREIGEGIARLEAKADTQESTITTIKENIQKQEEKHDRTMEKIDVVNDNIGKLEEKADRSAEQLGILEQKDDIIEAKLDRAGEKLDRQEEKLDILESKADRQEEKLDKLEGKADRQEKKLDRLEQKSDKQEKKLDKQESKLDRLEKKADRQEKKLDKIESKADKQERKLDTQEKKLDLLEKKADIEEKKLDILESKADKQENKLDRQETKLDFLRFPSPALESSIASQRGGDAEVTAAIATIKEPIGNVYMKFAIDINRNNLDEQGSYTSWKNFGKPAIANKLMVVSIDMQYEDGSNTVISALLTARSADGKIHQRTFENLDHAQLPDPDKWTNWDDFLGQP